MNSFKKNIYKNSLDDCTNPVLVSVTYVSANVVTYVWDNTIGVFGTMQLEYSLDNLNWIVCYTGSLTSPQTGTISTVSNNSQIYYRITGFSTCGALVSNVINGGKWQGNNLTSLNPVSIVPPTFSNPKTANSSSICSTGNQWTKNLLIDTVTPNTGTKLYLMDGVTPAIIGNLSSLDTGGTTFNADGIRWIRFANYTNQIFDVIPSTGMITGSSSIFSCP